MTTGGIYKFRLGRDTSGAYVGELVDDWGWVIAIQAEVAGSRCWGESAR